MSIINIYYIIYYYYLKYLLLLLPYHKRSSVFFYLKLCIITSSLYPGIPGSATGMIALTCYPYCAVQWYGLPGTVPGSYCTSTYDTMRIKPVFPGSRLRFALQEQYSNTPLQ